MKKKACCLPTHFDITLVRKDKGGLMLVVDMLMEHGTMPFQWEYVMLEIGSEYRLSIQSCWADNLEEIAQLLGDYGQD